MKQFYHLLHRLREVRSSYKSHHLLNIVKSQKFHFWVLAMGSNVVMWIYTLVLGRTLSFVELGVMASLMSLQNILISPAAAISNMIGRYVPHLKQSNTKGAWEEFYHHYFWVAILLGGLLSVLIVLLENTLEYYFHFQSTYLVYLFAPSLLMLYFGYFQKGILSGHLSFVNVGIVTLVESSIKLLLLFVFPVWPYSKINLVFLANSLSLVATILVNQKMISQFQPKSTLDSAKSALLLYSTQTEKWIYTLNTFVSRLVIMLLMSLDVLLVQYFLPKEAGKYALLAIVGKIVLFLGSSLQSLIGPQVSDKLAKSLDPRPKFFQLLSVILSLSGLVYFAFLLFPRFFAPLLVGQKGLLIIDYIPTYGLGVLAWVVAICFYTYALAMKNYFSQKIFTLVLFAQIFGAYFWHNNLYQIINVFTITQMLCAVLIAKNSLSYKFK